MHACFKIFALSISSASLSYGIVFDLDFTGGVAQYSSVNSTLQINASDVATGDGAPMLDVHIEAITSYMPDTVAKGADIGSGGNNGTIGDDLKIHIDIGTSTRFKFSLYDAGTTNLYNPGENYSFSFVVYDIDGVASASSGADVVTFYAPITYVQTSGSTVNVSQASDGIAFTGTGGEVKGQDGLADFSGPDGVAQENASVQVTIQNLSEFEFSYGAVNDGSNASGRNMLWDMQNLEVNGIPVDYSPVIPEPASVSCLLGLAGLAYTCTRRSRRSL